MIGEVNLFITYMVIRSRLVLALLLTEFRKGNSISDHVGLSNFKVVPIHLRAKKGVNQNKN